MVRGGGGIEYSEVFVKITDNTGNIIYDQPYQVQFELTGSPSGTTLEDSTDPIVKVAESGATSVTVVSGTAPGSVHLTVSLYNETDDVSSSTPIATAQSYPLTVVTGPPTYGEINFSIVDMKPIPYSGIFAYPLSVYFEDVHSNPVADSISVYFKLRENAPDWDNSVNYDFNENVTWLPPGSPSTTVLDSIVYTCIDDNTGCLAGVQPDTQGDWVASAHPAQIIVQGETGMENPNDSESYPGIAYSSIFFGSNSITSDVIVFAQVYSGDNNSLFVVDSRTNHGGEGIDLPCFECTLNLIAIPSVWDFSLPPFNTTVDNVDLMPVTITATLLDYFQFPIFDAQLSLSAEAVNGYLYSCNGEDTDQDGSTGTCVDGNNTPQAPTDCWTCVDNPLFSWVSDTGDNLQLARTSSEGDAAWVVEYSELINTPPTGDTPNITWPTAVPNIFVNLETLSYPPVNGSLTLQIVKSERD